MSRYWVIAPVESKPSELFDKVWQFDVANGLISIGCALPHGTDFVATLCLIALIAERSLVGSPRNSAGRLLPLWQFDVFGNCPCDYGFDTLRRSSSVMLRPTFQCLCL